jgi:bile acid:Na+ symporter, BASS family
LERIAVLLLKSLRTVLETKFFSVYMLPATLAFIMLGMGLSLTRRDFLNIARNPKGLAIGLGAQMLMLPVLAFLITLILPDLSPELKVGIVLLAACPGGATSNLVNYLLNSNLALSVSITTVNSFITQFTIPIFVNLALMAFMNEDKNIDLPFWDTLLQILRITVIPAIIGIYIRRHKARFADRVRKSLKYIMTGLLAVAMIGAIFIERNDNIKIPINDYWRVVPLTLLLNVGSMIIANYITRYFKLDTQSRITISVEVGLQNTGLAIAVATGSHMLNSPAIAIPAALYALFSFFTTAGIGYYIKRRNRE